MHRASQRTSFDSLLCINGEDLVRVHSHQNGSNIGLKGREKARTKTVTHIDDVLAESLLDIAQDCVFSEFVHVNHVVNAIFTERLHRKFNCDPADWVPPLGPDPGPSPPRPS